MEKKYHYATVSKALEELKEDLPMILTFMKTIL
jgi:hypothetical protein